MAHTRRGWIITMAVVLTALTAPPIFARPAEANPHRNAILISANPLAPIVGVYTGSVELPVAPNLSLFVQPEYFNVRWSLAWLVLAAIEPDLANFDFNVTSFGGRAGAHYFPNRVHDGLFVGVNAGYARMTFRYEARRINGNAFQGMVRGGYRAILGRVALTPYAEIGGTFLAADLTDLFADLELDDDILENLVERQFGLAFGLGISIALALY